MLRGSLDDFTLSDIFRLLSFTKKTGKLEVVRSAGDGKIFFRDGEVYFAQSSVRREPLGQKLVRAGALTESALMRALDINAQTGERMGEILLREGSITEEQLVTGVRGQIEDAVFDLLRWEVGEFEFESHERLTVEIPISVSVENLVMEASRRLDELKTIQKKIPSTEVVLAVAPSPPEGAREINISPDEWRVLVLLDGRRTVGQICEMANLDEFTGFRTLYGLLSSGLADVASLGPTDQPSPPVPPPMDVTEPREVQGPGGGSDGPAGTSDEIPVAPKPDAAGRDLGPREMPAPPAGADPRGTVSADEDPFPSAANDWVPAGDRLPGSHEPPAGDGPFGTVPDEAAPLDDDTFLSDILNGEPAVQPDSIPQNEVANPAEHEGGETGPSSATDADVAQGPDAARVDRAAVVRELAGLFTEEGSRPRRPNSGGSGEAAPDDGPMTPPAKRRVEDDEEINKGLIGRFIDGVKGM
jgi:Domain of unknown function (DUF4388)